MVHPRQGMEGEKEIEGASGNTETVFFYIWNLSAWPHIKDLTVTHPSSVSLLKFDAAKENILCGTLKHTYQGICTLNLTEN